MASTECPNPTSSMMSGIFCAQVPSSHPSDSRLWCMSAGDGSGGSCAPVLKIVIKHHTMSITTMTVVIFMICRARSLDSWIPWMFFHQK